MLTKLQNQIESEETSWQSLLQQKDSEIANLRVEFNTLQTKLSSSEEVGVGKFVVLNSDEDFS